MRTNLIRAEQARQEDVEKPPPVLHQGALVLVAFTFSAALGQLLFALLHILVFPGQGEHSAAGLAWSAPCLAYAVMSFSIVVKQRLSRWFVLAGSAAALLAFGLFRLEFWIAGTAGMAIALPLLFLCGAEFAVISRARFVHHLHNLQQITILSGMGLSLWHDSLRLPVLLSIVFGMVQWNRRLVGACPFTILEARLTPDGQKAALMQEHGYFLFYLRQWTGWPITYAQLATVITVLISSMLGGWVLAG